MTPWDDLAAVLMAEPALEDVNVYATPTESIVPPAVVVRPDTPWLATAGSLYPGDTERYAAIAVSSASSPADAMAELHRMVHAIANAARVAGWQLEEAAAPVIDELISPTLASAVTLTYNNCTAEESL